MHHPHGPKQGRDRKPLRKRLIFLGSLAAAAAVALILVIGPLDIFGFDFAHAAFGNETVPKASAEPTQTAEPAEKETDAEKSAEPSPEPTPDPTLTGGMHSAEVTKLQERLMSLGYLDIDETTDYYGPATAYAVSMFQRQHGLKQDGACGPETLAIVYSDDAKPYTLLEGTSGNDVDMLQARLMELGYLGHSTGYYGTETVDAIKIFQSRNGLVVDGKTGALTLERIYSADAWPTDEVLHQLEEAQRQNQRQGTIENFIANARAQLGKPYVWGAAGPSSFDCSGLVTYVLRQTGVETGRLNAHGFSSNSKWTKIGSMGEMQPGDLIFYRTRKGTPVGHVGIYVGDGMMVDASSANGKIVERSCMTDYWTSHFVCARRPW